MNFDLSTLCILGVIVLVLFFVLPRMMGGGAGPYSRRGPLDSEYDDPNIGSSGGFGRPGGGQRPSVDDPNIGSRGSFGRSRSFFPRRSSGSGGSPLGGGRSSGRTNSPNVGSRGGFGRSKK